MNEHLILVDGSSHMFRAYYALQQQGFSSPDGKPTGVLYGVLNMIKALGKQYPKSTIIIVFDGKGKGVRSQWYPKYKAQRPSMPEDMREQLPPLFDAIRALGIPLVQQGDWEADDLIGVLVKQAPSLYKKTYIATRDKDLAQLISTRVSILADEKTNTLWGPAEVEEKFGVPPKLINDYLALLGDTVDNIIGVEKVGPKTAAQLLKKYGSLEELLANLNEVPGKVGENLMAAKERLPLNKRLTTLISSISPLPDLASLKTRPPDNDRLRALYLEYGLRSFLKEMPSHDSPTEQEYHLITEKEQWQELIKQLRKNKSFVFNLHSEKKEDLNAAPVGFSFAMSAAKAYYVPCGHSYLDAPPQLTIEEILAELKPLFVSHTIISHGLKYSFHLLANQLQLEKRAEKQSLNQLPSQWEDVRLMSYTINSTASNNHSLSDLSQTYLATIKQDDQELLGKGKKQIGFADLDLAKAKDYAGEESLLSFQLFDRLSEEMKKEKDLMAVYQKIEKPLMPVLMHMERTGALLDSKLLQQQSRQLEKAMKQIAEQIFSHSKTEFNINSPAQLGKVLYEEMGFTSGRKTKGGKHSTAESILQELAIEHEFPRLILDYRSVSKLKNTYTDPLPQLVNPKTGRVHTSFDQAGAATGRLASLHPNLQNIPIRTAEGRRIRQAFIAPAGRLLASADYSQIELRIMAHLSKDKTLLDAFQRKQDIHRVTAAEVLGKEPSQVTDEERRQAKAINFGLIYGMSAFGLARQLRIEQSAAQEFIKIYFNRYPGVQKYITQTRSLAHKKGWAETLSGRRVYTPDINSTNFVARSAAERAAINAPVQGTAADIIKLAMLKVSAALDHQRASLILQVHDELLLEVDEDYIDQCEQLVRDSMTQVAPLKEKLQVDLEVDFGYGANWDEAH